MRTIYKIMLLASVLCGLSSCAIIIKEQAPRWKYSLRYNGVQDSYECVEDTYPITREYTVPEFFIMEDGKVVFRFYSKALGLELQAASDGPFEARKQYRYKKGDEFFDASFDWLYGGMTYECTSGSVEFRRSILPSVAYTVHFEFDLTAPDGSTMEIRSGVFTVYYKVNPRNTDLGLK